MSLLGAQQAQWKSFSVSSARLNPAWSLSDYCAVRADQDEISSQSSDLFRLKADHHYEQVTGRSRPKAVFTVNQPLTQMQRLQAVTLSPPKVASGQKQSQKAEFFGV